MIKRFQLIPSRDIQNKTIIRVIYKNVTLGWAGEIAKLVKHLPCTNKDLGSIPRIHAHIAGHGSTHCWQAEMGGSLGLTGQPNYPNW